LRWTSAGFEVSDSSSSRVLKKEIVSLKDSTLDSSKIYQTRPVSYISKHNNEQYAGFIAEEVAEVDSLLASWDRRCKFKEYYPEATPEELEEIVPTSIEWNTMVTYSVAELQKHETKIKALETQNSALQFQLQTLQAQVAQLLAAQSPQ
jgi:hypothetical protein